MHRNRGSFARCVCSALLSSAIVASAQRVDVPLNIQARKTYADSSAVKNICTAGNLEEWNGTLLRVPLPALGPGVYRVHVRLRISHTCVQATSQMAVGMRVEAGGGRLAEREFDIVDFERAKQWQDFCFPLTASKPVRQANLTVDWSWKEAFDPASSKRQLRDIALPSAPNMELDAAAISKNAQPPDTIALDRPLSELTYSLACDSVWLERVGEAVIAGLRMERSSDKNMWAMRNLSDPGIVRLWEDKSLYTNVETAAARGQIVNCSGAPQTWTIQAERFDGLNPGVVVGTQGVCLAASQTTNFMFEFPVGSRLWGHELRCSLLDETQGVAAAASVPFVTHFDTSAVDNGTPGSGLTSYRLGAVLPAPRREKGSRMSQYATRTEFYYKLPDTGEDIGNTGNSRSGQQFGDIGLVHSLRRLADSYLTWRQMAKSRGGHWATCSYADEVQPNDAIYLEILPACARGHLVATPLRATARYPLFDRRYAGELWDLNYTLPANAAAFIDWGPAATNLFYWNRYVYVRAAEDGQNELILHMVNQPPPLLGGGVCQVPDPLEAMPCRLRLPAGVKAGTVLRLSPDLEPERLELSSQQDGDMLTFTVPKLRFWNMIVVPFSGNGNWQ